MHGDQHDSMQTECVQNGDGLGTVAQTDGLKLHQASASPGLLILLLLQTLQLLPHTDSLAISGVQNGWACLQPAGTGLCQALQSLGYNNRLMSSN